MGSKRRVNVADLAEGQSVEEVYLVKSGSLREARNGKSYVAAELADATGSVAARAWDARPEHAGVFRTGSYVRVRGFVETYQGSLQMVLNSFRPVDAADVDMNAFLPATEADVKDLESRLLKLCGSVKDGPLAALLAAFFRDAEFLERFRTSPAASDFHHACLGGLLEHTVGVAELADLAASGRPELDRDLLVAGALLHDVGKVWELSAGPSFDYTDDGRLLGHIVLGVLEVERRLSSLKDFPAETRRPLLHLLASHHGQREFGSPVLPVTAEALALHHLDNLDAKTRAAAEAGAEPGSVGADWSDFQKMLGVRVYLKKRPGAQPPAK